MKTKSITPFFILSLFISAFSSCFSMDDMQTQNNSMTSMINNNMMRARGWMNNFYKTYQEFGIITTLSSSFNMYSFKRITGLNENELKNYSSTDLQNASNRIKKMVEYRGWSEKLDNFLNKVENARNQAQNNEEYEKENKANQEMLSF